MKQPPRMKKLENVLRSSGIVAGGFLGSDKRNPDEIIRADLAELGRLGRTAKQVAERMRQLTDAAKPFLGNPVTIDEKLLVSSEDYKGWIVCPWPHPCRFDKRITTVERLDTGRKIRWTDLNIHIIEEHGFFEGTGSAFRIEPTELVGIIF